MFEKKSFEFCQSSQMKFHFFFCFGSVICFLFHIVFPPTNDDEIKKTKTMEIPMNRNHLYVCMWNEFKIISCITLTYGHFHWKFLKMDSYSIYEECVCVFVCEIEYES